MRIVYSFALLLIIQTLQAQNIEGEIELDGFLLGQYRNAVHAQYGKPLKRIDTDDGWIYEFQAIRPDTSVYGLFKYPAEDTLRVFAIQLNGYRYDEMQPFKGLKLGADKAEVLKVLGNFNRTDTIDDPTVIVQYYEDKNYSVEIDEHGKLYGIQIYGSIQNKEPKDQIASMDEFENAILTKNIDELLLNLMPDVELYMNNLVITYTGSARDEFKKKNSALAKYLFGEKESVWYAFKKEKPRPEHELRIFTERKVVTTVYKFYKSKILEEIVFMPHAGKWKVYEIKFRK